MQDIKASEQQKHSEVSYPQHGAEILLNTNSPTETVTVKCTETERVTDKESFMITEIKCVKLNVTTLKELLLF